MKKYLVTLAVLIFTISAIAQEEARVWLDEDMAVVTKNDAVYFRTAVLDKGLFSVEVFYLNGNIRMRGHFEDNELTTETGLFSYYFFNGVKESEGHFTHGSKTGLWNRWDWEGNPKAERVYPDETADQIASRYTTKSAEFPGGYDALSRYISENLEYPEQAKKQNIQGEVNVAFVIDTTGYIQNVQVVESVHYFLDKSALNLVFGMPQWTPAQRRGIKVPSKFILPITFRLPDHRASDQ